MAVPRRVRAAQATGGRTPRQKTPPPKAVGRPKGPPSTIVNLRLSLDLLARLDGYIAQLEEQTGLRANRGMIARRALEVFLKTHASG
jgi:hypothetical protein